MADEEKTGGVVDTKYREKYGKDRHNGDDVASAMADFLHPVTDEEKGTRAKKVDQDRLEKLCADNDIDYSKYAHLNIGMIRMNVGNILRGKVSRGEDVVIGDVTIEGAAQEDENEAA